MGLFIYHRERQSNKKEITKKKAKTIFAFTLELFGIHSVKYLCLENVERSRINGDNTRAKICAVDSTFGLA